MTSTIADRLKGLPEAPEPSTELATISAIPKIVPVEFFKPGGSEDILAKLEIEVRKRAAELDISTEVGRKEIASLSYRVARSKTTLDEAGKKLVEDTKRQVKAVDAERAKVWDRVEALQKEVRKPLTDWEDAEKARVKAHEDALKWFTDFAEETERYPGTLTPAIIRQRIEKVESYTRAWEEFEVRAEGTKSLVLRRMAGCLALAEKAEAEAAEAERVRKEAEEKAIREREEAAAARAREEAERRAQAAEEAARKAAEAERERLENERLQAEARAKHEEAKRIAAQEKAARDLAEAEERRKREAEEAETRRLALERAEVRRREEAAAEAQRAQERAVQAERERAAAEQKRKEEAAKAEREAEEKRAVNKRHQGKIDIEVSRALQTVPDVSAELAADIIVAIKLGRIPHVSIAY